MVYWYILYRTAHAVYRELWINGGKSAPIDWLSNMDDLLTDIKQRENTLHGSQNRNRPRTVDNASGGAHYHGRHLNWLLLIRHASIAPHTSATLDRGDNLSSTVCTLTMQVPGIYISVWKVLHNRLGQPLFAGGSHCVMASHVVRPENSATQTTWPDRC